MTFWDVHPRLFVSAVSADLRSVRQAVSDVLGVKQCIACGMETFSTAPYEKISASLEKRIRSCQGLIHIVGKRYGFEPDPATLPQGARRRSFTQLEYDIATRISGFPVFVIVCKDSFPFDPPVRGKQPLVEAAELVVLQDLHRQELLTRGMTVHKAGSINDIRLIVHALQADVDQLRDRLRRSRHMGLGIGASLLVALLGIVWMLSGVRGSVERLARLSARRDARASTASAAPVRKVSVYRHRGHWLVHRNGTCACHEYCVRLRS